MTNQNSTLAELLKQQEELAEKIRVAKAAELESCRADALALIEARGFTVAEIFPEISAAPSGRRARKDQEPTADGRASVPPKYRNPENPAETWTGRGRQPKWVVAKLAEGKNLKDFEIA
jgi:DNA-binding protein H-NS